MGGLAGQDRTPGESVRDRRNADNLHEVLAFIGGGEVIQIDGTGVFVLILRADGGLENDAGELAVLLNPTEPGLSLVAAGLSVLLDPTEPGLQLNSGLKVLLATNPGLEFSTGLRVKTKTNGGVVRDADGLSAGNVVALWRKYTVAFGAMSAAALTNDIELFALPAGGFIEYVKIKHSTAFSGTGITNLDLTVGIAGELDKYAAPFEVTQPTGDTVFEVDFLPGSEDHASATSLRIAATATGANLDQLSAGSVDVWVKWGIAI